MDEQEKEFMVSLIEIRAWLRASAQLAEREGFDRTAKALWDREKTFNAWQDAGTHTVKVAAC